jgi:hypothetical protein
MVSLITHPSQDSPETSPVPLLPPMKTILMFLITVLLGIAVGRTHAQTLNWGSEFASSIVDSEGDVLDSAFVIEIGVFVDGFTPEESNVSDWSAKWWVFDRASYSMENGYFTSAVHYLNDGTSNSPFQSPGASSFAGLEAYLWVRNSSDPGVGTEWLLTRASSWVFPAPNQNPDCCDTEVIEWSVSDLTGVDVPVWGNQGGVLGGGFYSVTGSYDLQTHTFVPEPSSMMLIAFAGSILTLRRRRALSAP